jgi:hypothetical protein
VVQVCAVFPIKVSHNPRTLSGTGETIIKQLIFVSLESQKEKIAQKKYLKK